MATPPLDRILYVEDDPDIQEVASLALEAVGGFTLEVCSGGHEALSKAEAFDPHLVLLDVMMPDMDGPQTLVELRKLPRLQHTPVIFLTAKGMVSEIEALRQLGAIEVIPKPFDPMTVSDQIREIWARYHEV